MNLPITKNIDWVQGLLGDLESFYVPGDYSSHEITFGAKTSESLTADNVILKGNAAAGGSDDLISADYSNGQTKITIKSYYSDLSSTTEDYLYYNITADNGSERVILFRGVINVIHTLIPDADSPTYTTELARRWIFKLTPPDTFEDVLEAVNFEGDLSVSLSDNEITITSTAAEFTDAFDARGKGVSVSQKIDSNTYKVWLVPNWDSDYDFIVIDFFKYVGA